ncbi:MAG: hypothetical protein U1F39_02335 [Steroidobacteraceae bacterium]
MARTSDIDIDLLLDQSASAIPPGHAIRALGPSDSSDTGADMVGIGGLDNTSDRHGTGERASVEGDETVSDAGDIGPDSIVRAEGAGLGGGLDQAEEAQLGITDEELKAGMRRRPLRPGD